MAAETGRFHLVIEGDKDPTRGFNIGEIIRYKDVLFFMTWRDITIRYRQTALGVFWAILQPLLSAGVFSIFFGEIAKMPSDGAPYTLFSFSGLILWLLFANTLGRCSGSLVGNSQILTKVYFPRIVIPIANVFPGLMDFAIGFSVLLIGFAVHGVQPSLSALFWVPVTVLLTALLALGLGLFLGALNVRFRDVNNGINVLMQLMMFATPVVYPASMIMPEYKFWVGLNPMVGLIEAYRGSLLGREVDLQLLTVSIVWTVVLLFVGAKFFFRMEKKFADVV